MNRQTTNRQWLSLDFLWIGIFVAGLAAAVWYQDNNREVGQLAYQDMAYKLARHPALSAQYQVALADQRLTHAEYRDLYRAYRDLTRSASPQG